MPPGNSRPGGGRPGGAPGGGRPGPGNSDNEKKGGRSILSILKAIGVVIVVVLALGFFALRGCNFDLGGFTSGAGGLLSGLTQGGNSGSSSGTGLAALTKSKHTDASDRNNYALLQDIDGNAFTTVIEIVPTNSKNTDADDLKNRLANYRWYQLIVANNMGTPTQTCGHAYFPADVSLSDLSMLAQNLAADGKYAAYVMTPDAYNAYLADPKLNDIYYNETTYFGPAAIS